MDALPDRHQVKFPVFVTVGYDGKPARSRITNQIALLRRVMALTGRRIAFEAYDADDTLVAAGGFLSDRWYKVEWFPLLTFR